MNAPTTFTVLDYKTRAAMLATLLAGVQTPIAQIVSPPLGPLPVAKSPPVTITMGEVDPEMGADADDVIVLAVENASTAQLQEMADWLCVEAENYPTVIHRPTFSFHRIAFPIYDMDGDQFVFDKATQGNLAVHFRMRWS